MTLDLAELRRLKEAATKTPWHFCEADKYNPISWIGRAGDGIHILKLPSWGKDEDLKLTVALVNAADELVASAEELRMYKQLHQHALEAVDDVFQEWHDHEPILPGFLGLGEDKFKGVVKLAYEFKRQQAENAKLRELLKEGSEIMGYQLDIWENDYGRDETADEWRGKVEEVLK